jgi:hypothetical protein
VYGCATVECRNVISWSLGLRALRGKHGVSHMRLLALLLAVGTVFVPAGVAQEQPLRAGMIGLDTSHVIAFADILNNPSHPEHVPGVRVVAAYKGGSPDLEASATRVDEYTQRLQTDFGVEMVDTIEALCEQVDVVLLMSVDGRPHLEQVKPVFAAKKPVFIDKPLAGSLADALEIFRLAEEHGVPCFSSSSYRYYDGMRELLQENVGEVKGAISYGPCYYEEHHPDLFWYGVHSTEALFTVMGTGLESVVRTQTADTDVVTGVWAGGRVGTLHGLRNAATPHRVILFGTEKVVAQPEGKTSYAPLVREVVKFFQTGIVPVSPEETTEIFAFMEAADESKRRGGVPVRVEEVLREARAKRP